MKLTLSQITKMEAILAKLQSDIQVMQLYGSNQDMVIAAAQSAEKHIEQAKEILK